MTTQSTNRFRQALLACLFIFVPALFKAARPNLTQQERLFNGEVGSALWFEQWPNHGHEPCKDANSPLHCECNTVHCWHYRWPNNEHLESWFRTPNGFIVTGIFENLYSLMVHVAVHLFQRMIDVFVFDKILDLFSGNMMNKVFGTLITIGGYIILNYLCAWSTLIYGVVSFLMRFGICTAFMLLKLCNWQKTNLEFYSILVFVRYLQTFTVFVCRHLVLIVKDVFGAQFELRQTLVKWTFFLEVVTCGFLVVIAIVAVKLPSGNQTQSLHQTMFELATLEHRLSKWITVHLIVVGMLIAGYIIVDSYSPVWVQQNFQTQELWFSWDETCSGQNVNVWDRTAQAFFNTQNANWCVPSVFRRFGLSETCRIEATCDQSYLVGIEWGHGNPDLNLYQPVHFLMFLNFALIVFFIVCKSKRNDEYKSVQLLLACKACDLWEKLKIKSYHACATMLAPQNAGGNDDNLKPPGTSIDARGVNKAHLEALLQKHGLDNSGKVALLRQRLKAANITQF